MSNWHYYEAHVTLDPVRDPDRLATLEAICRMHCFRIADLVMLKSGEINPEDSFITARDDDFRHILLRMRACVNLLRTNDFVVRRYKVEYTLIDSRHDDWDPLDD